jgi:hypothetical protein
MAFGLPLALISSMKIGPVPGASGMPGPENAAKFFIA